jgi:hypothetical protein
MSAANRCSLSRSFWRRCRDECRRFVPHTALHARCRNMAESSTLSEMRGCVASAESSYGDFRSTQAHRRPMARNGEDSMNDSRTSKSLAVCSPCPICGGVVAIHSDTEDECTGCHHLVCADCKTWFDVSIAADPENKLETIPELQAAVVAHWNQLLGNKPHENETPVQQPVAWRCKNGMGDWCYMSVSPIGSIYASAWEPLYARPELKAGEPPKVGYNSNGDAYLVEPKASARYPGMQICNKPTPHGPCLNEVDHEGDCDWRAENGGVGTCP